MADLDYTDAYNKDTARQPKPTDLVSMVDPTGAPNADPLLDTFHYATPIANFANIEGSRTYHVGPGQPWPLLQDAFNDIIAKALADPDYFFIETTAVSTGTINEGSTILNLTVPFPLNTYRQGQWLKIGTDSPIVYPIAGFAGTNGDTSTTWDIGIKFNDPDITIAESVIMCRERPVEIIFHGNTKSTVDTGSGQLKDYLNKTGDQGGAFFDNIAVNISGGPNHNPENNMFFDSLSGVVRLREITNNSGPFRTTKNLDGINTSIMVYEVSDCTFPYIDGDGIIGGHDSMGSLFCKNTFFSGQYRPIQVAGMTTSVVLVDTIITGSYLGLDILNPIKLVIEDSVINVPVTAADVTLGSIAMQLAFFDVGASGYDINIINLSMNIQYSEGVSSLPSFNLFNYASGTDGGGNIRMNNVKIVLPDGSLRYTANAALTNNSGVPTTVPDAYYITNCALNVSDQFGNHTVETLIGSRGIRKTAGGAINTVTTATTADTWIIDMNGLENIPNPSKLPGIGSAGHTMTFLFNHDATATPWDVTWGTIWKTDPANAVTSNADETSTVTFRWNGTAYVQSSGPMVWISTL